MKRTLTTGAATLVAMLALGASALQAKTLVYCSEGSPENFTPALNTTVPVGMPTPGATTVTVAV